MNGSRNKQLFLLNEWNIIREQAVLQLATEAANQRLLLELGAIDKLKAAFATSKEMWSKQLLKQIGGKLKAAVQAAMNDATSVVKKHMTVDGDPAQFAKAAVQQAVGQLFGDGKQGSTSQIKAPTTDPTTSTKGPLDPAVQQQINSLNAQIKKISAKINAEKQKATSTIKTDPAAAQTIVDTTAKDQESLDKLTKQVTDVGGTLPPGVKPPVQKTGGTLPKKPVSDDELMKQGKANADAALAPGKDANKKLSADIAARQKRIDAGNKRLRQDTVTRTGRTVTRGQRKR